MVELSSQADKIFTDLKGLAEKVPADGQQLLACSQQVQLRVNAAILGLINGVKSLQAAQRSVTTRELKLSEDAAQVADEAVKADEAHARASREREKIRVLRARAEETIEAESAALQKRAARAQAMADEAQEDLMQAKEMRADAETLEERVLQA